MLESGRQKDGDAGRSLADSVTIRTATLQLVAVLPIAEGDYIADMFSGQIYGEEWLFLMTAQGRYFIAQPNDAGGLNVQEILR